LDTNGLDTSHSQRLNSGKSLGTGRCGWLCPIELYPNKLPRSPRYPLTAEDFWKWNPEGLLRKISGNLFGP